LPWSAFRASATSTARSCAADAVCALPGSAGAGEGRVRRGPPTRPERPEAVGRLHEAIHDAGFRGGVTGVGNDVEGRLRPAPMELPRRDHRAHDVVAALDDHGGDLADPADLVEELVGVAEKRAVHEVVALDPREGVRELPGAEALDERR